VSLDWSLTKIENFEKVCYVSTNEGSMILNPVTHAMIFKMMSTGIGWELTEENAGEFYARCLILDKLDGGTIPLGAGYRDTTPKDVRLHIGLGCNVSPELRGKWTNRVIHQIMNGKVRLFEEYMKHESDAAKK
jgi:hypothetical protein